MIQEIVLASLIAFGGLVQKENTPPAGWYCVSDTSTFFIRKGTGVPNDVEWYDGYGVYHRRNYYFTGYNPIIGKIQYYRVGEETTTCTNPDPSVRQA
jgi:hypothetical protein